MTRPSCLASSLSTALRRSSNSPRYLAPAINAAISSDNTRLSFNPSGTSPLTMRCAKPSTMAVLPTPGSPISTGLFLVRRCSTCMVRRISSSRPITGSSLPSSARLFRSSVYLSNASRLFSASGSFTDSPPRTSLIFSDNTDFTMPARANNLPASPLSSQSASKIASLDTYWSPRCCASLSARLKRRLNDWDICTSPLNGVITGRFSSASCKAVSRSPTLTPARCNRGRALPPCCRNRASNK